MRPASAGLDLGGGGSSPLELDARLRARARASSRSEGTPWGVDDVRHHRPKICMEHQQDGPCVGVAGHSLLDRAGVGPVMLALPVKGPGCVPVCNRGGHMSGTVRRRCLPLPATTEYRNEQRRLQESTCKSVLFQSSHQYGRRWSPGRVHAHPTVLPREKASASA